MAKKKDKKELKAYGYVRVSTSEQAEEGISIEVQRGKIKAYATLHDLKLQEPLSPTRKRKGRGWGQCRTGIKWKMGN